MPAAKPRITIYHNPRCSKSRQTLELLRAHGVEPTIVEYLKDVPSAETFQQLFTLLGKSPREVMRHKEDAYRSAGLDDARLSDSDLIAAITEHPILLERPIVVVDDERAAIGRPPESVLDIL